MRPHEAAELLQVRRPRLRRVERVLHGVHEIEDLRRAAHRRWPRGVRGYVEGGADAEVSLRRNRAAYAEREFLPATLRDVDDVALSTRLLGRQSPLPFALAPTGYSRMMHPDGERAVAVAARSAGVSYAVTTMSTVPLEDVAAIGGDLWFQLYVWRDRGLVRELVERAASAGYRALVLTVDTAVTGRRLRDARSGFTLPPRLGLGSVLDMARHPAWCLGLLRAEPVTFANFAPECSGRSMSVMDFAARQFDPRVSWADVEELRTRWDGPLVLKGVLSAADAVTARSVGVDAVVLSNHGGRQLDQAVAPLDALPAVREAVGEDFQVLVDSGIRRGTDLAVALGLGADGCLTGRPYLYGLGAAGQAGVTAAISILAAELSRAMALLGVNTNDQLRSQGGQLIRRRSATRIESKE